MNVLTCQMCGGKTPGRTASWEELTAYSFDTGCCFIIVITDCPEDEWAKLKTSDEFHNEDSKLTIAEKLHQLGYIALDCDGFMLLEEIRSEYKMDANMRVQYYHLKYFYNTIKAALNELTNNLNANKEKDAKPSQ